MIICRGKKFSCYIDLWRAFKVQGKTVSFYRVDNNGLLGWYETNMGLEVYPVYYN